jgi:hypothetical protein
MNAFCLVNSFNRQEVVMAISKLTYLLAALTLAFALTGGLQAQLPSPDATLEVHTFSIGPPVMDEIIDQDVRPALTQEQKARIEEMLDKSPPGGLVLEGNPVPETNTPAAGTESRLAAYETVESLVQPEAPGTFTVFRQRGLRAVIPKSEVSNVAEVSGDMAGRMGFLTGNWFAARTDDGGNNWTYINPYSDMADFCCDQRALYDPARDIFLWMRMGIPDGNGENRFRLSVDAKEPFSGGYWSYDVTPTSINAAWTGEWWDYTEMQMTADVCQSANCADNYTKVQFFKITRGEYYA